VHHASGLLRHVEADLVQQRYGTDRKTEARHRTIDQLDADTLLQQVSCLVHVG
jgi:hypothetical protein